MSTWVMELQDRIVKGLEELEASVPPNEHAPAMEAPVFQRDHWLRPQGGEGSSCVIRGGRVFEKGGVNVSVVHGKLPPAAIRQMRADHKSLKIAEEDKDKSMPFFAAGISIVLHPWNPHAPTIHMNYRYFELDKAETPKDALDTTGGTSTAAGLVAEPVAWWFGGGSDLTPSYLYSEDAEHFHNSIKSAADRHHTAYYPAWKKWADKYFYVRRLQLIRQCSDKSLIPFAYVRCRCLDRSHTEASVAESGGSFSMISLRRAKFTDNPVKEPCEIWVLRSLSASHLPTRSSTSLNRCPTVSSTRMSRS
jgi:coproporphyrinogen III oxidase